VETPIYTPPSSENGNCSSKPYCKDIKTCEEAMFYLNVCGLKRLDSD
jgi:hypothetical protein